MSFRMVLDQNEPLKKRLVFFFAENDASNYASNEDDFDDAYDEVPDEEYELEQLKRFLFKKKPTPDPQQVTTKTYDALDALKNVVTTTGKPNLTNKPSAGEINNLINGLIKDSATNAPTTTTTPTTNMPSVNNGDLNSLLVNLMSKASPPPSTTTTTTNKNIFPVIPNMGPCSKNPCNNNGLCQIDSSKPNGFTCKCATSFAGDLCENVNYCLSLPCKNGGTYVSHAFQDPGVLFSIVPLHCDRRLSTSL
jgi:hypothetical protein